MAQRYRPVLRRRFALLPVIAALVVGACSSSGDAADRVSAAPETAEAAAEATAVPTPVPTPEPTATPIPRPPTIAELLEREEPLNIAHAGGDQAAPHSTMYAFATAVDAGADMLEMDVQLTGDGVLIVQHDDTVDRTTDGTGPVVDFTLAEIQALDAGHWFAPGHWPDRERPEDEYIYRGVRTGQVPAPGGFTADDFRIVTFRELSDRFPELPFDIEIKGDAPAALAVVEALAAELRATDRLESSIVVSFDDSLIAAFTELEPSVATSPGVDAMTNWILLGEELGDHAVVQIPPEFNGVPVLTEGTLALAAAEGIDVWVWPNDAATQENQSFYEELIGLGITGVIAGYPEQMEAAITGR